MLWKQCTIRVLCITRGVARGGGQGARNLADQLTLFEPGWAEFAPHTTSSPTGFKKLSTPLNLLCAPSGTQQSPRVVTKT